MKIDAELMELLREMALIHAHLDNDLVRSQPHWRAERDVVARQIADYYNLNLEDGK